MSLQLNITDIFGITIQIESHQTLKLDLAYSNQNF